MPIATHRGPQRSDKAMTHKTFTPAQLAGFGRFYRELADLLDIEWKLEVMHFGDIHAAWAPAYHMLPFGAPVHALSPNKDQHG